MKTNDDDEKTIRGEFYDALEGPGGPVATTPGVIELWGEDYVPHKRGARAIVGADTEEAAAELMEAVRDLAEHFPLGGWQPRMHVGCIVHDDASEDLRRGLTQAQTAVTLALWQAHSVKTYAAAEVEARLVHTMAVLRKDRADALKEDDGGLVASLDVDLSEAAACLKAVRAYAHTAGDYARVSARVDTGCAYRASWYDTGLGHRVGHHVAGLLIVCGAQDVWLQAPRKTRSDAVDTKDPTAILGSQQGCVYYPARKRNKRH